jgi:hypothetical protein
MNLTRSLRRAVAVTLASVVTLGLTGCTTGGDDGESLEIDDGGEATATVAAAIESASSGSGRFTTTIGEVAAGDAEDSAREVRIEGEFDGDAVRSTATSFPESEDELSNFATERLRAGDRTYVNVDGVRSQLEQLTPVDGSLYAVTDGDEFQGYATAGEMSPFGDLDPAPLDGFDWIDTTELPGAFDESSPIDPFVSMMLLPFFNEDPFAVLSAVTEAHEVDPDAEGERRFTASIPFASVYELLLDESVAAGAQAFAQGPIEQYVADHTAVTAVVVLDSSGRLVRSEVSAHAEIEEQYADCAELEAYAADLDLVTEFRDLDADVTVSAPDPATVMSLDQLAAAFPNDVDEMGDDVLDLGGPGETTEAADFADELATVDGPRDWYDVVDDLQSFGYLVGLGVDPYSVPADARWIVNAEVLDLSDEELVARYAEVDAALAQLPRTSTAIGELTRPELLLNVQWGLEAVGGDPSVAAGMSDAELGALIDAYVEEQGGAAGDAVWGPLPEGVELSDPPEDDVMDGDGFTAAPGEASCPE